MGDSTEDISVIVLGSLNTDIFAIGVERMLKPGESCYGAEARFGPGGKSRNIAQMTATLLGEGKVAMIGRTSKDPWGLWHIPVTALERSGVNTKYVRVFNYDDCGKMPGIALIPVDKKGENQIYGLPGINEEFCREDIDNARPIFETAKFNNGLAAITLEMPTDAARHAIMMAKEYDIPIFLDAGGIREREDYSAIIKELSSVHLIKMNQHEAAIITGMPRVTDYRTITIVARNLREQGAENVLITIGEKGAYMFTKKQEEGIIIRPPEMKGGEVQNTTGCGDQAMAGIIYKHIQQGRRRGKIEDQIRTGINAGTIQAYKTGIIPVTKDEIKHYERYENMGM